MSDDTEHKEVQSGSEHAQTELNPEPEPEAAGSTTTDNAVMKKRTESKHGYEVSLEIMGPLFEEQQNKGSHNPEKPKVLSVPSTLIDELKDQEKQVWGKVAQIKAFFCCQRDPVYWNEDVRARWLRFWLIGGIPIVMLFIMNEITDGGAGSETYYLGQILGTAIALMFTFYFVNLIIQLGPGRVFRHMIPRMCQRKDENDCGSKRCYRWAHPKKDEKDEEQNFFKIETRLSKVEQWAKMRIANTQVMYKLRAIQSISEFSAISGGQANQMIANLGPFAWVGVAMMYIAHMQCEDGSDFHLDITDVLLIIGVNGIVMIGLFELNQFDLGMKHGHYIGVLMSIGLLFASMIQGVSISKAEDNWAHLAAPIVLNGIAWPTFIYWQLISSTDSARQYEQQFIDYCEGGYTNKDETVTDKLEDDLEKEKEAYGQRKEMAAQSGDAFEEKTDEELRTELKKKYIVDKKLKERISALSVKCVAYEGTAIYCTTLALSWYLFQWGHTCDYGCIYDGN